jgi:hypothetical protein
MTKTEYEHILTDKDRIRAHFTVDKGEVVDFLVQYEALINEKWYAVVRFDTAHGFPHIDILHFDGRKEKFSLSHLTPNDALTMAQLDVGQNWERYRENYLKGINQ